MPRKKPPPECVFLDCHRPIWAGGGPEETFCLFHSEQYEAKSEEFIGEIESFKQGEPSELFQMGQPMDDSFISFFGFRFPKVVSFHKHRFEKHVSFSITYFEDDAYFVGAKIVGAANFRSAMIEGNADFRYAGIEGNADFRYAKIEQGAYFRYARIIGGTKFSGATIKGDGEFSGLTTQDIDLSSAIFGGKLTLTGATIRRLLADDLTYGGIFSLIDVTFTGRKRNDYSSFVNVFMERANIVNVDFSFLSFQNAFIREVNFDRVCFNRAENDHRWRRESRLFGRPFEAIHEEMVARLENEDEFIACALSKEDDVQRFGKGSNAEKRKFVNWQFAAAETSYRSLKHVLEKQHAHGLARKVRAGELECKYQQAGWWPFTTLFEKFLLFMYRFLNGFGLKWLRALVFFLATFFIFTINYWQQPASYMTIVVGVSGYSEQLDVKRTNIWEAVWHGIETTAIIKAHTLTITEYNIRWIEGLQRILSPALLLLFLQAARNAARD